MCPSGPGGRRRTPDNMHRKNVVLGATVTYVHRGGLRGRGEGVMEGVGGVEGVTHQVLLHRTTGTSFYLNKIRKIKKNSADSCNFIFYSIFFRGTEEFPLSHTENK